MVVLYAELDGVWSATKLMTLSHHVCCLHLCFTKNTQWVGWLGSHSRCVQSEMYTVEKWNSLANGWHSYFTTTLNRSPTVTTLHSIIPASTVVMCLNINCDSQIWVAFEPSVQEYQVHQKVIVFVFLQLVFPCEFCCKILTTILYKSSLPLSQD